MCVGNVALVLLGVEVSKDVAVDLLGRVDCCACGWKKLFGWRMLWGLRRMVRRSRCCAPGVVMDIGRDLEEFSGLSHCHCGF